MKRFAIALFAGIAVFALTQIAAAQSDYVPGTVVSMESRCEAGFVVLEISFNVSEAPPENIVGWIIERTIVGECLPDSYATEVMPWPELGGTYQEITIAPVLPNRDELYRIWAVDDQGAEVFIPWPSRDNFQHATCLPGPSTVGYIVMMGDRPFFEPCPGSCWWGLSPWDTGIPDDLAELADTGTLVNIYGELKNGMEGPYISYGDLTWSLSDEECGVVAAPEQTWDAVKAFYR